MVKDIKAHRAQKFELERLESPCAVSSKTFQIVAFNSSFTEAFGDLSASKEYLIDFVDPDGRQDLLDSYSRWHSLENDQPFIIKCKMRLKLTLTVVCELWINPITMDNQSENLFQVVIKPVKEMKGLDQGDFLRHMREIYFIIDHDGQVRNTNPALLKSIKYQSLSQIIGTNVFKDLKFKGSCLKDSRLWEKMIAQGGRVTGYEIIFSPKDGSKTYFNVDAWFYYNDKLEIEGIEGFATDVTSQKTLILNLENTLRFTNSLLQALPTPLMYKNKDLVFEGCNRAFFELTGVSHNDLIGKKAGDIWETEFAVLSEQKEKEALKTGRYQIFEGYITNAKKDRIAVIMVTACHPGPKGRPAGVISSFLDITARKAIELAIKRNEEEIYKENVSLKRIINPHLRKTVMVGASPAVMALYDQIYQAARTNMPVLIEGESGTGKELVAMEIHRSSDRSEKEVVAVNCSAIPRELTESMFFGHTKGAFTGAFSESKGYIQAVHGSTLFLDEINSIRLDKQAKLLRVLESGEVTPVGGSSSVQSNFRLISASNQDLKALVEEGGMRADFYYRLKVLSIKVPPLRERKEDIPMLAYHFLNQYKQEHPAAYSADKKFITKELFQKLKGYDFPGNIRELRNVLYQYFATGNLSLNPPQEKEAEPQKTEDSSAPEVDLGFSHDGSLKDIMNDVEKRLILQLLNHYRYNRTQVAKHLQIGRKTLYNKMKAHGIDKEN